SRDRRGALRNFFEMIAPKSFFDLGDDLVEIFFARIIGSDDGEIGVLVDDLTHERAFLAVAISAATENDDQTTRSELAQCFQNVEQCVRRVRIIDENLKLSLCWNNLETARNLR